MGPFRIKPSEYRVEISGEIHFIWQWGVELVFPIGGVVGDKFPADRWLHQVTVDENGNISTRTDEDPAPEDILVTAEIEGIRNLVVIAPDRMKEARTVVMLKEVRLF